MKKNKVLLTKTGDTYNCRYVLDQTDIIDEKVDKGVSGKFPQIIPCRLEKKDNQREFIYEIGNKVQLTEFLKKEINKKQMLTLLYNLLSGLEAFGMNMISLSYVAKDIQYVFVAPESLNVYFIVAGVDKEITDLNEVRNFVKDVICNAHYFEMDRDNYVARLITFTNKLGTFSVGDMKEFVNQHGNVLRRDYWREKVYPSVQALEKSGQKIILNDVNLTPLPINSESLSSIQSFSCDLLSPQLQNKLKNEHKKLLISISGRTLGTEAGATYDLQMNRLNSTVGEPGAGNIKIPKETVPYIVMHSHPTGETFTHTDLILFAKDQNMKMIPAVGNNGFIYAA